MNRIIATYPEPRIGWRKYAAWALAFVLLFATLFALFTFDDLPQRLQLAWPGVSDGYALLLATKLVILGVFSLPFLLEMKLSPLMRICSMICAIFAALSWLLFIGGLLLS